MNYWILKSLETLSNLNCEIEKEIKIGKDKMKKKSLSHFASNMIGAARSEINLRP